MNNTNRPSWLLDIPAEKYHAATKSGEFVSSHRINVFRKCPLEFRKRETGEIVEGDTANFILGRATHSFIIEGEEAFAKEFEVSDGPVNERTGKPFGRDTAKFREWAAEQKKPTISTEEFSMILKMADAVRGHDIAKELFSSGIAEGTVRTKFYSTNIQARLDWFDPERNIIVDLKTCADVDRFQKDIRDFGYISQLAFYAAAVKSSRLEHREISDVPVCWLVAVEKREPFRVAVYEITAYTLDDATFGDGTGKMYGKGVYPLIEELESCRRDNIWPTRYEGWGRI